jgi:hypothetical protein
LFVFARGQKKTNCIIQSLIALPSEDDKPGQSLQMLTSSSDAPFFRVLQSRIASKASYQSASSDQSIDFKFDLSSYLVPSHNSFSFASDAFLCVHSLDISDPKVDLDS